jgi:hypothetical protein
MHRLIVGVLTLFYLVHAQAYDTAQVVSTNQSYYVNPGFDDKLWDCISRYFLPVDSSQKKQLDRIFLKQRAIANEAAFRRAGFKTLFKKQRSFIHVASHPLLPGYLVKVYLDNEYRQKYDTPGGIWLIERCKGAEKIRSVIQQNNMRYFQVPRKWLYPLPISLQNSHLQETKQEPFLLLVEDMKLVPAKKNLEAWKTKITRKHLDELYTIISQAQGSSYRPDNIWLSENGKFSFIDTEYPDRDPDFKSIRRYLSPKMGAYWNRLVRRGPLLKKI